LSIPFLPHLPDYVLGRWQFAVTDLVTDIGAGAKDARPPIILLRLVSYEPFVLGDGNDNDLRLPAALDDYRLPTLDHLPHQLAEVNSGLSGAQTTDHWVGSGDSLIDRSVQTA
jgi:hypothetical protein